MEWRLIKVSEEKNEVEVSGAKSKKKGGKGKKRNRSFVLKFSFWFKNNGIEIIDQDIDFSDDGGSWDIDEEAEITKMFNRSIVKFSEAIKRVHIPKWIYGMDVRIVVEETTKASVGLDGMVKRDFEMKDIDMKVCMKGFVGDALNEAFKGWLVGRVDNDIVKVKLKEAFEVSEKICGGVLKESIPNEGCQNETKW